MKVVHEVVEEYKWKGRGTDGMESVRWDVRGPVGI
jgi:hypothetical protein